MNLNGKVSNPGDLRTPVLLAPRTVSEEMGGFQRPLPAEEAAISAWAKWSNIHGSETWAAAISGAIAPATVLIRYQADLDQTWYISKDNGESWFEIKGMDDIQERHEYIELKVSQWRPG
jgi:SPP1 family predicted phage head-tail adaptor